MTATLLAFLAFAPLTVVVARCGAWAPQPNPVVPPAGATPMTDPTDIPTCGKGPGWNCADHPLLEPEKYCDAIMASSRGKCPIQYNDQEFSSLYALLHYFLPGTSSYTTGEEKHEAYTMNPNYAPRPERKFSAPRRDSWGYQYYSMEHQAFRFDQLFYLDYGYDVATGAKPGAQFVETVRASSKFLIDVNIGNGPSVGVLDNDDRGVQAVCAYIPEGVWKLMNPYDLSNGNITTYCGTTTFPQGYLAVGTNFDVYMVRDRWFAGVPIFWYVDRQSRRIAGQLYYQSGGFTRSQNYIWDFSKRLYSTNVAREMFRENPHYYFDINEDMLRKGCADAPSLYGRDVISEVLADSFPDRRCCGPPTACVPC